MALPMRLLGLGLAAAVLVPAPVSAAAPDRRDGFVYFLMTDRFADGDPSNNDQKAGEFGPADPNLYSGGDLAGVRSKLDYIQGLGATAVWLTPPVSNVWYDPSLKMAGYHGYWATDFTKVDAHLGGLEDYRGLAADLHARSMLLIQDIVTNHTGDFFSYAGAPDPADPGKGFRLKPGMVPPRPTQHPFSANDPRDPEARRLSAYHWTPDVADFNDEAQLTTGQVSGLDDIDTSNPLVRRTLKESYGGWIKAVGVDGLRVDTARYVEHEFWRDFIHSADPASPGVGAVARAQGQEGFLVFGEVWTNAVPFDDKEDALTASYLGTAERPEMGAVLNFPLAGDLRAVFGKGAPPALLKYRLESMKRHYAGGRASVNFIDNHDMPRFLSEGGEAGLVQALAALFTLPGLPVLYAGTEQGFTETRASMFAQGFGSGGKDHFDRSHRLYVFIKRLAGLRAGQPALARGSLVPLHGAAWGPGPLAYRVDPSTVPGGSGPGSPILVVFNTAEEEMLAPGLETGLPEGTRFEPLLGLGVDGRGLRVGRRGALLLRLAPRSTLVLKALPAAPPSAEDEAGEELLEAGVMINTVRGGNVRPPAPQARKRRKSKAPPPLATDKAARVFIEGSSAGVDSVSVVVDGRLGRPVPARWLPDERWVAELDASLLPDGEHTVTAMGAAGSTVVWSPPRGLKIDLPYALAARVDDPLGDDHGPEGRYRYPLAPGFEGRADIRSLSLYRRGSGAKLVITMAQGLSGVWNPAFGFDHVCFHVFMDFPEAVLGRKGLEALPGLGARMKDGRDWDFAAFLAGWKVGLYGAGAATVSAFGPALAPAPQVRADRKQGSVEVEFSLDAFPGVRSFDGAGFYVATWDYDGVEGRLRPLAREPAEFVFGGGEPAGPKVMDDAAVPPEKKP
ncbi:MAG: hypothetical protein HY924_10550 [Elusimicrobia bacterium]|nr:hypothetical protein [Elusimicrobiota bacterium]